MLFHFQIIWFARGVRRDDTAVSQLPLSLLEVYRTPLHRGRPHVPGEAGGRGQELAACPDPSAGLLEVFLSLGKPLKNM